MVLSVHRDFSITLYLQGTFRTKTGHEGPEREYMCRFTLSLTTALYGGEWSAPCIGRFTPGKEPVPIVQTAGWFPGPVLTSAENLAPTGIRSPDRAARSESAYRLSYPGPRDFKYYDN
jgi:hypothetical protein